jgi:hypothetical protein
MLDSLRYVLKEIAMHNRIPSRRRQGASPGKGQAREGNTVPVQGQNATQDRVAPRMPHERDESADSQASSEPSSQRMAQAAREDIERGVVDTDKGPVLDETYEKLREDNPDSVKKFSP